MAGKLITVFGATGAQGGSVVQSLLHNSDKAFTVRGITRDDTSDKANALAAQGVQVVKADGLIKDQMLAALKGSWGFFLNTNSDDPSINQPGCPTEEEFGKAIIDAASEAGVQHVVYSGAESASKITNGAVPNKAFDEKNAVGEYAKSRGFASVTVVSPGWYMENYLAEELADFLGGFPWKPDSEGYLTQRSPRWGGNEEIPFISMSDDYGDLVHGIFLAPEKYNGRLIQASSDCQTSNGVVQSFQKVTGKKSRYVAMEDWRDVETFGVEALETVKRMFGFCQHSGGLYYGVANDLGPTAELKAAGAAARGVEGDQTKLMTVERFFKNHFAAE